jgi:hypothetical protein
MKPVECEFEADALAAVLQSRWPERVDAQLRAHIEGCAICSDVVAIASAIDEAREDLGSHVVVPDSGRVWWLAQLRARREAAETAGRPISAAQVVAFACAIGLLGACFGATSTWFQSALRWMAASVPSAIALLIQHGTLVLATALVLFLVPTAVYLALGKD